MLVAIYTFAAIVTALLAIYLVVCFMTPELF